MHRRDPVLTINRYLPHRTFQTNGRTLEREYGSLYEAIRLGTAADVERLLKGGADPNGIGNIFSGSTLVLEAAERGDCEMLRLLIEYGADPEKPDFDTRTAPLQSALTAGKHDIVQFLRAAGCTE